MPITIRLVMYFDDKGTLIANKGPENMQHTYSSYKETAMRTTRAKRSTNTNVKVK